MPVHFFAAAGWSLILQRGECCLAGPAARQTTGERVGPRRRTTANDANAATVEARAREEHGAAGQLVELAVEELDRLHLVLQDPSGGLVDDPPVAIGERVVRCLAVE